MKKTAALDFWVGLFVVLGFVALLFLALKAGNMSSLSFQPTYAVKLKFDNIGGLKPRAPVKSAGVTVGRVDSGAFWSQMQGGVDVWSDVGNGVIKSIVFGFAVTFIALFQGYEAQPTPEGVSRATTKTVVYGSLAVLGLDFLLTALMFN